MTAGPADSLLHPGGNCWRVEHAHRVAVAIDGEAYFRAVREAILGARKRVTILGWDIHSRLRLERGDEDDGLPTELGALLDFVASERGVQVYVLSWDFAVIYLLERESFPLYTLNWKTHRRVHFQLDSAHPPGASQHQKIVVVDDALACCGGLDLSQWRWDTPAHKPGDERRVDPQGKPYPPFHDLQMIVDGDAAAALGELARQRWQRATGEALPALEPPAEEAPWPGSLTPLVADTAVGIARTQSAYDGCEAVREVEQLYLDAIAAAERYIYIENQYLTAHRVARALAQRLREDGGPELVIVLPLKTGGWLEQQTMDVVRCRVVKQLREADTGGRLRLYFPQLLAGGEAATMVHAKLMIVDDRLLRIGSSNLSNRSMGLDSECDLLLAVEPGTERAVGGLLESLLAQHLGVEVEEVRESREQQRSLIASIERLRRGERSLQPLDPQVDPAVDALVPDSALIDPERPMDVEHFVSHFVPDEYRPHSARRVLVSALVLAALLGLAAAWRWTALGDLLDLDLLVDQVRTLESHPLAPLLLIGLFALAASLAVPLTLLVIACVLAFGAVNGFIYSLLGAQLSAMLNYFFGRHLGRDLVRRYAGKTLNAVSRRLSRRGVLAIVTVRVVPVAPFAVVNLVAGASHISLRDFSLGTLLGSLPGIAGVALFADGIVRALRSPDSGSFAWVVGLLAVLVLLAYLLGKVLSGGGRTRSEG